MSHDPSRMLYAHITCGNSPCTCVWNHPPLAIAQIHCWSCTRSFLTMTELSAHHLEAHEKPVSRSDPSCPEAPYATP